MEGLLHLAMVVWGAAAAAAMLLGDFSPFAYATMTTAVIVVVYAFVFVLKMIE